MPELYRPGIPTQYERPGKTSFSNADLKRPSMAGLYDAAEQARSEQENYRMLNSGPPQVDPLEAAKKDLALAYGNDTYEGLQQERFSDHATREDQRAADAQHRAEDASRIGPVIKDAIQAGAGAGSFAPGPIGMASSAVLAGMSGYDALRDAGNGDYGSAALDTLGMIPAIGHGVSAVSKRLPGNIAAARGSVLRTGRDTASKMFPEELSAVQKSTDLTGPMSMDKQSSIPPVRHYWDALDMGVDPAKAAKIGAGRDKQSMEALRALQNAGKAGETDLSGEIASMTSQPPSAQEIAGARAKERFGKTYRSEGGAPARSVPSYSGAGDEAAAAGVKPSQSSGQPIVTKEGIFDPSGRYLAPLAGSLDDIAYWTSRSTRDPRR